MTPDLRLLRDSDVNAFLVGTAARRLDEAGKQAGVVVVRIP